MPETKIVYQTDDDGIYIGQNKADESPLEPNVFLIPKNCVTEAPPSIPDGSRAKWNGSSWGIETIPVEEEEVAVIITPTEESVRMERDVLLSSCDWTQLPDATADKEAWATYRQALRDLPSQAGFPTNVTYPTKPE